MSNPKHCSGCIHHWKKGMKGTKFANWCCSQGRPLPDAISNCKVHDFKRIKTGV